MREERHLYPDAALFLYIILLSLPLVRCHQTPLVRYHQTPLVGYHRIPLVGYHRTPLVGYHRTPLVGYLYRNLLLVIMILVIISSCQLMALDCGRRPYLI